MDRCRGSLAGHLALEEVTDSVAYNHPFSAGPTVSCCCRKGHWWYVGKSSGGSCPLTCPLIALSKSAGQQHLRARFCLYIESVQEYDPSP